MQQLLTHTAGFTYGWGGGPVAKKYQEQSCGNRVVQKNLLKKFHLYLYCMNLELNGIIQLQ